MMEIGYRELRLITLMEALQKANKDLMLGHEDDMLRAMLIPLSDSQVLYVYSLPELRKLFKLVKSERSLETDFKMKANLTTFLQVVESVGKEKSKVQEGSTK